MLAEISSFIMGLWLSTDRRPKTVMFQQSSKKYNSIILHNRQTPHPPPVIPLIPPRRLQTRRASVHSRRASAQTCRESVKSGRENGEYVLRRPQSAAPGTKKAGLERPACRCHIKVCVSILHAIIQLRCPSCSVTDACSCCNATERLPELR